MIYLVRHGQTEFNRQGRMQGHADSPLTELGLRQAGAVGRLLESLVPAPRTGWRLVSSPLGRACATAAIISQRLGLPVELDDRLKEMSWGPFDGRLRAELEAETAATFGASGWAFDAPGTEPYESVAGRLSDWLDDLPPEPDRRVIAVSHGVAGRVLRGLYADLARAAAAEQDVPQDAVYLLQGGSIERFDCVGLKSVGP